MDADVSLGIKIGAGLAIMLFLISVLFTTMTVIKSKGNEVYQRVSDNSLEDPGMNLKRMASLNKPISAPTIYKVIYEYGGPDELESFTFYDSGVFYDFEDMPKFFHKKYYISYVETTTGFTVKVGDGSIA